jgi:hypothetical protein
MHVIFDGSTLSLATISNPQSGGGPINYFEALQNFQRGHGHFSTFARQRGAGVGSVLRHIWRYLKPLGSAVAPIAAGAMKEIGQEGLKAAAKTLEDVSRGEDIKSSISSNANQSAQNLLAKAQSKLKQKGSGRGRKKRSTGPSKRKGRNMATIILKPQTVPGRAQVKKRRVDSLGYY